MDDLIRRGSTKSFSESSGDYPLTKFRRIPRRSIFCHQSGTIRRLGFRSFPISRGRVVGHRSLRLGRSVGWLIISLDRRLLSNRMNLSNRLNCRCSRLIVGPSPIGHILSIGLVAAVGVDHQSHSMVPLPQSELSRLARL